MSRDPWYERKPSSTAKKVQFLTPSVQDDAMGTADPDRDAVLPAEFHNLSKPPPQAAEASGCEAPLCGKDAGGAGPAPPDRAPVDLDQAVDEAHGRGFQKGLEAGAAQAEEQEALLRIKLDERWRDVLERLAVFEANSRRRLWRTAVELAEAIALRVLERELVDDSDFLLDRAEDLLLSGAVLKPLSLYLHPEAVVALEPHLDRLTESLPEARAIELHADTSLSVGSCRLCAEDGELEYRLEDHVRLLTDHLDRELGRDLSVLEPDDEDSPRKATRAPGKGVQ